MSKKRNKRIEGWIEGNPILAIDEQLGIEYLGSYLSDLDLLEKGVKFSDLGISDRREKSQPCLLSATTTGLQTAKFNAKNANSKANQVLHLKLNGAMRNEGGLSSRGISDMVEDIREGASNPNIAGILMEVDSGGGSPTAAANLMSALEQFSKPVVTVYHTMGSGAVWGTLPSNKIYALSLNSRAGSIGVFNSINKSIFKYLSKNYIDVYSSLSGNKNRPFRQLQQGSLAGFEEVVDQMAMIFHQEVKRFRDLDGDNEQVLHTLSGEMFFAKEAIDRGLADGISSIEEAFKEVLVLSQNGAKTKSPAITINSENISSENTKIEDMKKLNDLLSSIQNTLNAYSTEDNSASAAASENTDAVDQETNQEETTETNTEEVETVEASDDKISQLESKFTELESNLNTVVGQLATTVEAVGNLNASIEANNESIASRLEAINSTLQNLSTHQKDLEETQAAAIGKKPVGSQTTELNLSTSEKTFAGKARIAVPISRKKTA